MLSHDPGSDGTKVWDLVTRREVPVPASSDMRGATTALLWVKRDDHVGEALVMGTQGGYLAGWREDLDKESVRLRSVTVTVSY